MGQLKPGVKYVYEKANGVTYAREAGSIERIVIGEDYEVTTRRNEMRDSQLWYDICEAARTNPTLQEALERVIIIYYLSKQEEPILWHPV